MLFLSLIQLTLIYCRSCNVLLFLTLTTVEFQLIGIEFYLQQTVEWIWKNPGIKTGLFRINANGMIGINYSKYFSTAQPCTEKFPGIVLSKSAQITYVEKFHNMC